MSLTLLSENPPNSSNCSMALMLFSENSSAASFFASWIAKTSSPHEDINAMSSLAPETQDRCSRTLSTRSSGAVPLPTLHITSEGSICKPEKNQPATMMIHETCHEYHDLRVTETVTATVTRFRLSLCQLGIFAGCRAGPWQPARRDCPATD
jgi:hypothetical protein